MPPSRTLALLLTASASMATLAVSGAPGPARAAQPGPLPGTQRWVAVSVATAWVRPGRDRSVDAPSVANPADPGRWLAGLTLTQRKWFYGRLETQVHYGDTVVVLGSSGAWTKVAVTSQPSPRNAQGYPGWIPTSQLTGTAPGTGDRTLVVTEPRASLFEDPALTIPAMTVSYETRLPSVGVPGTAWEVVALDGRHLYLQRSAAMVENDGSVPVTGTQLVAQARKFLGLPYLWGGTSGFGYDCSGLTHSVHAALGVTIPRDAGPQFAAGRKVARSNLAPGDLVFFRNSSGIHHVGMYIGGGRMIHAPGTGRPVAIVSLQAQPYAREYAGARRYVG